MSDDLIERVARAICVEDAGQYAEELLTKQHYMDSCRRVAQAAIAAINLPGQREAAARAALEAAAGGVAEWFPCNTMDRPEYAAGRALVASIRAIDPAALRGDDDASSN